jgi:hypothetical protein
MWALILNFLSGPIIGGLLKAYQSKLAAGNTTEKIAADLAVRDLQVQQREAEVNASVIVAEQGNWVTRWVRPAFAAPFVFFTWKVVVWDKILAIWTHGTTDPLDPKMWGVYMAVVIAYFGGRSLEKVATTISNAITKKEI